MPLIPILLGSSVTSTGKYFPETFASDASGDWTYLNKSNASVDDTSYANSDLSDGEAFRLTEIRPVFGGTPDTDNTYTANEDAPLEGVDPDTWYDVVIFGTGAVITWTGDNPTAAQLRSPGFGLDVQYLAVSEDLTSERFEATNFSFDGGPTPIPAGATINKITLHVQHWHRSGDEDLFIDAFAVTVEFTEVTGQTKSGISRFF